MAGFGRVSSHLGTLQSSEWSDPGWCAGPFDGTGHLTALLDRTMDGSLRHALLGLLEALVALPAAGMEDAAMRAARANGRSFVEAGGLELAVDLVACERPFLRQNELN